MKSFIEFLRPYVWILPLHLIACSIPLTSKERIEKDWQETQTTNTIESYNRFLKRYDDPKYSEKASIRIRRINIDKNLANNWHKLRKGMPLEEVDKLIGPLDEYFIITMRGRIKSISANESMPDEAPRLYTYYGGVYTLDFDIYGRLSKWRR